MTSDWRETGAQIIDRMDVAIAGGCRRFNLGSPWPEYPGDDNWGNNEASGEWLGYHVERIRTYWRRRKVMEKLGVDSDNC